MIDTRCASAAHVRCHDAVDAVAVIYLHAAYAAADAAATRMPLLRACWFTPRFDTLTMLTILIRLPLMLPYGAELLMATIYFAAAAAMPAPPYAMPLYRLYALRCLPCLMRSCRFFMLMLSAAEAALVAMAAPD